MTLRQLRSAGCYIGWAVLLTGAMMLIASCSPPPVHHPTADTTIYVASQTNVSTFPLAATGTVAPTTAIAGSTTTFSDVHRTAVDSSGNIYVSDCGADKVDVYPGTATGNVAPTSAIAGSSTGFSCPSGIALDSTG